MSVRSADLLLIVGLTGVGKSTVVDALLARRDDLRLLPNRRRITDEIILPEAQRRHGGAVGPVPDRLERFRLTAAYRAAHPGGMTHALSRWLAEHEPTAGTGGPLLFDNLRGLDEVRAAVEAFPNARFLVLDASPLTRLARLVGRADPFDRVEHDGSGAPTASPSLVGRFQGIDGLDAVFDAGELAGIVGRGALDPESVASAAQIIVEEQRNYDSGAAIRYLQSRLPPTRVRVVDTETAGPGEITDLVERWLDPRGAA